LVGAGEALGETALDPTARYNPIGALGVNLGKKIFGEDPDPAQIARTVGSTVSGVIPGGETAFNYLADVGTPREQSPATYGKALGQELQVPAIGLAGMGVKSLATAGRGALTGARDFAFGTPDEVLLQKQALNDDIFANKLDYGSRVTAGERAMIGEAENAAPTFVRENPVANIDKNLPARQQMEQFQANLNDIETKAVLTRKSILPEASLAEEALINQSKVGGTPLKVGISFDDLPSEINTAKGSYGLNTIAAKYGDVAVEKAKSFVEKQFGIVPEKIANYEGAPTQLAPSRVLRAEEANLARQQIDAQIRELGGFDDTYWANQGISPSTVDGYVEGLRFYRQQLDNAVKGHLAKVLGPEKAQLFSEAGQNISMAKTYQPMAERFKLDTGQAFTPGSAKKVPPGRGPLSSSGMIGGVIDELAPTRANRRMQSEALQRESNAIDQLQQLVELKQQGSPQPLPRGWAQIKASVPNKQMFAELAFSIGLISSIDEIDSLHPEIGKRLAGAVAKQYPQAFEPTPDNINVIDGQFQDPMEKDLVVMGALDKSPSERANIIGNSFRNKYTGTVTPVPTPTPTPMPSLPELSQALSVPTDTSYNSGISDQVKRLEEITAIQDFDGLIQ